MVACQNIFSEHFKQKDDLIKEENNGKVHETADTVDPSQPTSQVHGPSGLVREVQVANHSSSLAVQTHEKVNMVVIKHIQLIEAVYKRLIDVTMGSTITYFPISMMNDPWVNEMAASKRNKLWYFLVCWLQPV